MSLAVATIGAGVLALPSAFGKAGILVSLATVAFIAYLTVMSIRYLSQAIEAVDLHSYESLSERLLGIWGKRAAMFSVVGFNIGAQVGYIIVMGNLIEPFRPNLAEATTALFSSSPTFPKFAYWACVMLPLSFVRNIESLKLSSTAAIFAALFTAGVVCIRFFFPVVPLSEVMQYTTLPPPSNESGFGVSTAIAETVKVTSGLVASDSEVVLADFSSKALVAVAVMMFAYNCQSVVFSIKSSLRVPTVLSMTRIAIGNVVISGSVYAAIGSFGYLSFKAKVTPNILSSYDPKQDILAAMAYLVYSLPVTMAYATLMFPTRNLVADLLAGAGTGESGVGMLRETEDDEQHVVGECPGGRRRPGKHFIPISFTLSLTTLILAVFVPNILFVCGLLGAVCSSLVCFILPSAFVLRLHYDRIRVVGSPALCQMWFMFVFGVCAGVLGTFATLMAK